MEKESNTNMAIRAKPNDDDHDDHDDDDSEEGSESECMSLLARIGLLIFHVQLFLVQRTFYCCRFFLGHS